MDRVEDDREQLTEVLLAAARQTLDEDAEPPATAEIRAYLADELPAEQSDRVRAWLVAHPDAARRALEMERTLEIEAFVNPASYSSDAPADLAEEASWRAVQGRLAREEGKEPIAVQPIAVQTPTPRTRDRSVNRWLAMAASIFFVSTGALLFRVVELTEELGRPIANPLPEIKFELDTRSSVSESQHPVVPGKLYEMHVWVPAGPDDCLNYVVDLRTLDGKRVKRVPGLERENGRLVMTWRPKVGKMLLVVEACGTEMPDHRFDFVRVPE